MCACVNLDSGADVAAAATRPRRSSKNPKRLGAGGRWPVSKTKGEKKAVDMSCPVSQSRLQRFHREQVEAADTPSERARHLELPPALLRTPYCNVVRTRMKDAVLRTAAPATPVSVPRTRWTESLMTGNNPIRRALWTIICEGPSPLPPPLRPRPDQHQGRRDGGTPGLGRGLREERGSRASM